MSKGGRIEIQGPAHRQIFRAMPSITSANASYQGRIEVMLIVDYTFWTMFQFSIVCIFNSCNLTVRIGS